ncbi:MAG: hypothetical protein AB7S52_11835 [Sphaerochaetaceae bacterium]
MEKWGDKIFFGGVYIITEIRNWIILIYREFPSPRNFSNQGGFSLNDTLIALIVTSLVSIFIAVSNILVNRMYANRSEKNAIRKDTLENFLNPLCALLRENNNIFTEFGPPTFPSDDQDRRMESGTIWNSIKENILLKNLFRIREIILSNYDKAEKLGLSKVCDALQMHCISFIEYNNNPSELHQKYKYNNEWLVELEKAKKKI